MVRLKEAGGLGKVRVLRSALDWQGLVEGWGLSGLSKRAYCEQSGVSVSLWSKWHRKLTAVAALPSTSGQGSTAPSGRNSGKGSPSLFIPVHVKSVGGSMSVDSPLKQLEIKRADGHEIRIVGSWEGGDVLALLTASLS